MLCKEELLEEIEGDLFEEYQNWRSSKSTLMSNILYFWTIIRSIPNFERRKKKKNSVLNLEILKHYLKTTFRSLNRDKSYASINLFGLSTGLASSLILILLIIEEARKDYDLADKDRLYLVQSNIGIRPSEGFGSYSHPGVGSFLYDNFPQVEAYTLLNKNELDIITGDENERDFYKAEILIADSSFFKIFPQIFIKGNLNTALNNPNNIVITESIAHKYYGSEDPMGREIRIMGNRRTRFTVSAVIQDPKPHSSIQFELIYDQDKNYALTKPGFDHTNVFLKITEQTDIKAFEKEANKAIYEVVSENLMKSITYRLKPFEAMKYDLETPSDVIPPTDKKLYGIFTTIAAVILLLAIINYINLTAARSLKRGQEVGIRKILGSGRGSFMAQFLIESWCICLIALGLAFLMVEAFSPILESALNTRLTFKYYTDLRFISITFLVTFFTGLLAGLYPALLVSRFSFSHFLKGNIATSGKGQIIRRMLVVFQFSIAIILIIGAVVIQRQLNLFQSQKLNYNPNQYLVLDRALTKDFNLLREELLTVAGVNGVSITSSPPAGNSMRFSTDALALGELIQGHNIDQHYADLLNLQFISGDNFDPKKLVDAKPEVIINETLADLIKRVNPKNSDHPLEEKYPFLYVDYHIQGVVKDFHLESLHEKIKPMVFFFEPYTGYNGAFTIINLQTINIQETIDSIQKIWETHIPLYAFRYEFLDSRFNNLYTTEMRLGKIFQLFTAIAIAISCLGLLGLISFIVQSKIKEIAVRKVLGARIIQIIKLFLREVYWLVGISSFIGVPIALLLMNKWLENFAYRTEISTIVLIATVASLLVLTICTVALRTIGTARLNPVKSLRND